MKVIIKETKEVKKVPLGYALNYLLPKGLAEVATAQKLALLKKEQIEVKREKSEDKLKQRQLAEKLDGKVIEFQLKSGDDDKLHGGVTKKDIGEKLELPSSKVVLDKPLKKVGDYQVGLKFGNFKAEVKVKIKTK